MSKDQEQYNDEATEKSVKAINDRDFSTCEATLNGTIVDSKTDIAGSALKYKADPKLSPLIVSNAIPLHVAVKLNNMEVVKTLIENASKSYYEAFPEMELNQDAETAPTETLLGNLNHNTEDATPTLGDSHTTDEHHS